MAGKEENLVFTLTPQKSQVLADLDFADDNVLLSDEIDQAQELLIRVEKECNKVGLELNAKKTKSLAFNVIYPKPLHTADSTELKWKDHFKYCIFVGGKLREGHQHR